MLSSLRSRLSQTSRPHLRWTAGGHVGKKHFNSEATSTLPSEADVVIIGGGAIGCSTLYHLSKRGVNAVLVEKDAITAGTTWHSAGLVWRLRPNDTDAKMINRTRELVKDGGILSQETGGLSCGWNSNGGLFIANTKERLDEYKRLQTIGRYFGIESHVLSQSESKDLYPLMNVDDVVGTLYSPGDGTVEPSDYVNTLSRACRKHGGKIYENVRVTGFETKAANSKHSHYSDKQEISGVNTNAGFIKTNKIAICGGVWTRDICKLFNNTTFNQSVNVPLCAMRHAYVLTDKIDGISKMPCIRDHDLSMYLRVQGSSLQVGGYEPNPIFWDKVEPEFAFSLFDLDWDVFSLHLTNGCHRVPIIEETGIKSEVCGPESFTPDHKPLLGQIPEIKGVHLGAAFNSGGIMLSGGCGMELANYIIDGCYRNDMFGYDIMRYHPSLADNDEWIKQRSHEAYAKNYSIVFPQDEPLAARTFNRTSHVHKILLAQGCVFQDRHGFERPGWFNTLTNGYSQSKKILNEEFYDKILENVENYNKIPNDYFVNSDRKDYDYYGAYVESDVNEGQCTEEMQVEKHENYLYRDALDMEYTFEYGENHDIIGEEVYACRNNVAVFDQSYFGKFFLSGNDATKAIDYICTNMIGDKPVGSTIYTQMCNDAGRVECDLGVSHIDENEYYITAGGASCTHDYNHIMNIIISKGYDCKLDDKSDEFSMFSVQGPNSRELLEEMVNNKDYQFDNDSFPFGSNQLINVNYNGKIFSNLRFIRLTFVGELGWELHIPKECSREIYCLLFKLGEKYGVKPAGYRAIDSLSCEKGYLHWHEDVGVNDTPLEANVAFIVNKKLKNTDIDFKGRNALLKQSENGLKKKLVHVRVNKENGTRLHGLETIYRNGESIGYLRRSSFDYTQNQAIGTGYIFNNKKNRFNENDDNSADIVDNVYIQGSKKQKIAAPKYEIEILGQRYPCQVTPKAVFDPKSERVQGNYAQAK